MFGFKNAMDVRKLNKKNDTVPILYTTPIYRKLEYSITRIITIELQIVLSLRDRTHYL